MAIVRLKSQQADAAASALTDAFWDDPLLRIVISPDEAKRRALGKWFFGSTIEYGARYGAESYCNEDASAVSVWFPPGKTTLSTLGMLRTGFGVLPFKVGLGGVSRFMKAMATTEKFHKSVEGPHWYLLALGTKPELQGTGLGSALIEIGSSQADAAKLPCYLETATESNVAFYSKRGFAVAGQADVLGFTLWGMVRPPQ